MNNRAGARGPTLGNPEFPAVKAAFGHGSPLDRILLGKDADDDAYEPAPVVIPVRGALTLNQLAW